MLYLCLDVSNFRLDAFDIVFMEVTWVSVKASRAHLYLFP